MRLASLRDGGRDGTLIVVDRAMSTGVRVDGIAPTLEQALENWAAVGPKLQSVYDELNAGRVEGSFPLEVGDLASPLPRSHQFLDGSVYLHHMEKARKARGADMPPNHKTDPVMYQGLSDSFVGPRDPMPIVDTTLNADYEAEIAVVLDDVPAGVSANDAAGHIALVVLLNDYTFRALTKTELPKGFGFLQAKPTSSFGPVAVTPDELGDVWDGEKFHLEVRSHVNDTLMGNPNAGEGMFFTYPQLIAHAARTRPLSAGTIIGAGSISNQDESRGHGCIAEARIAEQIATGTEHTPWLQYGDVVAIEAFDKSGESVFGRIEQVIAPTGG